MSDQRLPATRRGLTAIDGALALIGVLLVVQMWLVTATLESYLAGHSDAAVPGAIVSTVLFAGSVALYRFVVRVDRESRGEARSPLSSGTIGARGDPPWQSS